MQGLLILVVLMSLASYRATRFVIDDSLIDGPRDWFKRKVLHARPAGPDFLPPETKGRAKLFELVECPYCMSVWIASAIVAATWIFTPIALPVLVWGATCGAVMAWWRLIEPD